MSFVETNASQLDQQQLQPSNIPIAIVSHSTDPSAATTVKSSSDTFHLKQENIFKYWKNFDKKSLENDLNEGIDDLNKNQALKEKFREKISNLIKSTIPDDKQNVFESLSSIELELEQFVSDGQRIDENCLNKFTRLHKLLVDDLHEPLEFIELAKVKHDEQMNKSRFIIKQLRERLYELKKNEKKKNSDSELIRHLSAKVSKTLSVNSNLSNRLYTALNEIESLKKLVLTYRNHDSLSINDQKVGFRSNRKRYFNNYQTNSARQQDNMPNDSNITSTMNEFTNNNNNNSQNNLENNQDDVDSDDDDDLDNKYTKNEFNSEESNEQYDHTTNPCHTNTYNQYLDDDDDIMDEENDDDDDDNDNDEFMLGNFSHNTNVVNSNNNNNNNAMNFLNRTNESDGLFDDDEDVNVNTLLDNLNTTALIRRMKEFMIKYKISQSEVGRRILGVKKSHVSFLLANLKPWNMLTRKGKEPYIRMYMFLKDKNNIKKFFNNQYVIPNVDINSILTPFRSTQHSQPLVNTMTHGSGGGGGGATGSNGGTGSYDDDDYYGDEYDDTNPMEFTDSNNDSAAAYNGSYSYSMNQTNRLSSCLDVIPYDISAIPENKDFNTVEITDEIKDVLKVNKISQELFCRAVLNLSDRILCKPKPWSAVGKKAREHYFRMYMFLNDPQNIEKINQWKQSNNFKFSRKAKRFSRSNETYFANSILN